MKNDEYLYKATAPRDNLMFYPSVFYRTEDYFKNSTNPKAGYIEDKLLFV